VRPRQSPAIPMATKQSSNRMAALCRRCSVSQSGGGTLRASAVGTAVSVIRYVLRMLAWLVPFRLVSMIVPRTISPCSVTRGTTIPTRSAWPYAKQPGGGVAERRCAQKRKQPRRTLLTLRKPGRFVTRWTAWPRLGPRISKWSAVRSCGCGFRVDGGAANYAGPGSPLSSRPTSCSRSARYLWPPRHAPRRPAHSVRRSNWPVSSPVCLSSRRRLSAWTDSVNPPADSVPTNFGGWTMP
jgi:hypothetical protein